jgi:hypothetical protein
MPLNLFFKIGTSHSIRKVIKYQILRLSGTKQASTMHYAETTMHYVLTTMRSNTYNLFLPK